MRKTVDSVVSETISRQEVDAGTATLDDGMAISELEDERDFYGFLMPDELDNPLTELYNNCVRLPTRYAIGSSQVVPFDCPKEAN